MRHRLGQVQFVVRWHADHGVAAKAVDEDDVHRWNSGLIEAFDGGTILSGRQGQQIVAGNR